MALDRASSIGGRSLHEACELDGEGSGARTACLLQSTAEHTTGSALEWTNRL
jgi:hypothetical protein